MESIPQISTAFIEKNTSFRELVAELKKSFSSDKTIVPQRHHHDFPNQAVGTDSTLLLMPAWQPGKTAGVKIVTVNPENDKLKLPTIQGTYIYIDTTTGSLKAILEAKSLTAKRTAAASALASSYLSNVDASSLLMIGTGTLSENLVKAHAAVRPIKKVFIWGRDFEKATTICHELKDENFECRPVSTIEEKISEADIISCATLSATPLVFGKHLRNGQHIDLVGAYKKDMREADDEAIKKSSVFVDTLPAGLKESGDIAIPLVNGIIKETDIKTDLFGLCSGKKNGRTKPDEITLFKSVGHALEDLCAADYYFKKFTAQKS